MKVGSLTIGKTSVVDDDEERSPKWGECFRADVAVEATEITFSVFAAEATQKGCFAKLSLYIKDIMNRPDEPTTWKILSLRSNETSDDPEWFPLANDKGKKIKGAMLRVEVRYQGLPMEPEVTDTYFNLTSGNKVTLYQDAETPAHPLHEEIQYEGDLSYEPASAWQDMFSALNEASILIYFTGWSVWTDLVMVRDGEHEESIGELLVRKAEEGVTVLGLVWDEKTSNEVLPGLMGTHDEETCNYFKGTGVHCGMVSRQKTTGGALGDHWSSTCYSHHQKTVIVDVEGEDGTRHLVAFMGGLDLTNGRYDSPEHPLFSTLQTVHQKDFYQNCVKVDPSQGPRQPWHDIHSKVST